MNRIRNRTQRPARAGSVLLLVGILLLAANLRAPITSLGPLIGDVRADMSLSNGAAGFLTTLALLFFGLLSPIAPRLARKFGMETTLLASLLLITAGILLRTFSHVSALFAGTALIGMGIALGNVLVPALIKRDFAARLGPMTGLYSVSMNLWAAVASGLSIPLAESAGWGWRGSLGCWALLSAMATIVWLPQLRARGTAFPAGRHKTAASGIWRSKLAWQISLFMGLQSLLFYINVSWLPEILQSRGISGSTSGWLLSLMQFVSLPATFLIPILASRYRRQDVFAGAIALLLFIGYGGLWLAGDRVWLASVWVVLLGIAAGAAFSLSVLFFSLRTNQAQESAELSGMAQSVGYLLASVGPIALGLLHDSVGNWTVPLAVLVALSVCLFGFGLASGRDRKVRPAGVGSVAEQTGM
ncbi:CynX/NimT family MFS transporter [Cohnella zeiphila]|uniref:MFS transporter n=1 Tax=Cohnella zeiphila TaxID=2761120 RepID=A0A7X0VX15_9BACL|nr:MFS transporter [Cohnella zeiphila]MBB6733090.1 MFS transporter [Cohnella zeiphila]